MRSADLQVSCDGIALGCSYISGDEPRGAVVLLHGIPSVAPPDPDDRGYEGFAEQLAHNGWLAVWADLRAVRRSRGFFSLEGWVRDAMTVVEETRRLPEAAGLRLALIGSSAGGCVATEAVRRGAEVDALALLAAPAAWLSFASGASAGVRYVASETGMPIAPEVLEDPTSWAAEFEAITTEESIERVEQPILIVHGTADDVVPVEHADRIARRAPEAELVVLEGAGHQLRRDPTARRVLDEWLEKVLG